MIEFILGLIVGYIIGRTWVTLWPRARAWWEENKNRGGSA